MRPSVGVATREWPELPRLTREAARAPTYDGPVRVVVVHDGTPLDTSFAHPEPHGL